MSEPTFQSIGYEVEDQIATITIRGGKMNSFTPEVQEDIVTLREVLYESVSDLRCVVFRGADGVFSSGADMSVFEEN
jgi:enoyl-CoA hydratase/carnithine racemase